MTIVADQNGANQLITFSEAENYRSRCQLLSTELSSTGCLAGLAYTTVELIDQMRRAWNPLASTLSWGSHFFSMQSLLIG
jgi:hypothetical protein